jgi:hypothetical protein
MIDVMLMRTFMQRLRRGVGRRWVGREGKSAAQPQTKRAMLADIEESRR